MDAAGPGTTPKRRQNSRPAKPEETEAERFEALAKRLVKVPKSEIDRERAKANGKKPKR